MFWYRQRQTTSRFHCKGIDNLGWSLGRLGGNTFKKGERVEEESGRGVGSEPGVEGGQGGVVGTVLGEWQADKPAYQQIGVEELFQRRVGATVSPGADDRHAHKLLEGEGGRGARRAWGVMVALAGGDDGSRVVPLVEEDEGTLGAAAQQRAIDQGFDPGQDGGQKLADEDLNHRRNVRQIAGRGPQHGWYNGHT